jgi:lactate racemase
MELKYGKERVKLVLDISKVAKILVANEKEGLKDPLKAFERSIKSPIGSVPLIEMVKTKKPKNVVIIVNDVSRPTPYNYMLPPLLDILHQGGVRKEEVTFIIATGVHKPHTTEQSIEIFGKGIFGQYRFIFHDCDHNLVDMGKLKSGNFFQVNEEVAKADFIITTGVIIPHYFAGFSGGRKSILPGVSGRETIQFNHSQMVNLMGNLPDIKENPISLEMLEAAKRIGVDFILNVITNSNGEIVKVVAGDLEKAWYKGINISAEMYQVPIKEKVDVAIVSAGGFPRDINVFQAQKALEHADHVTKKGGVIILLAECSEGLGDKTFEEWMRTAKRPEDNIKRIKNEFVIGGHKAFAISQVAINKEVIIISSLDKETTELLFATKMNSLKEALSYVEEKYHGDFSAIIMPEGGLTVPVIQN